MKLRNQTAELSGSGETWVSLNRQVMRSFQQNSLLEGSRDHSTITIFEVSTIFP
jgi:hypothetical protein